MRREFDDLALDATLRAAAPYQIHRRAVSSRPVMIHIEEQDIRTKVRERRVGATLLFVVDGSGSMGAERRMTETKTAIMSLLMDAYQKRDKVGLVVFRQRKAEVLLDFTNSVERAARLLSELPVGGRTPLSAGLEETGVMLRRLLRKEPLTRPVVIILTDGKGNVSISDRKPRQEALLLGQRLVGCYPQSRFVVVDTEGPSAIRLGLAQTLATSMAADYYRTDELKAEELINLIREQVV
jgi:magnesium chelatase subunit D